METIASVPNMRALAARLRAERGGLSLVPTMGSLHAGHEALIGAALAAGRPVVVSIFVNPMSFGSNENFAGYPRSLQDDLELCARLGVDAVFTPGTEEIYPRGYSTFVTEEAVSKPLCGVSRPTHFRAPVVDLRAGHIHFHGDAAITSVLRRIGAVIPEKIVRGSVPLHSLEDLCEIVGIEEGAAAGIAGKRNQGFLRREVGVQGINRGLPGIGRGAAQARILRPPRQLPWPADRASPSCRSPGSSVRQR